MRLPTYAIILAGGYGTRFWPLSRRARPKQFLPLTGKQSLLQQTYRRVARVFPPSKIYVVGNGEHRRLFSEQLPRVPPERLLLEPVGRNTAAAVALAAEHVRRALPASVEDAVLGVFPADHAIRQEARFRQVVRAALAAAEAESMLVVLGIPPTEPHTGYGYIERGQLVERRRGTQLFRARRFTEKPGERLAVRYLRTRRYFWNSGMFFWRLSMFDGLLARHLPRTGQALRGLRPWLGRRGYESRLKKVYPRLKNISVDYALAEPAAARGVVRMLPARIGWSDLGSWSALYAWQARQAKVNLTTGPVFLLDARGSWLQAEKKLVAAIGIENLVVVDTPEALLLCPRNRAQEVGKIVDYLKQRQRDDLL